METRTTISKYIPQLDGLRGIAILMVIAYHYFPAMSICKFGWTGVDLFFVLSGFLITSRLFPFIQDKKLSRKFYWNRLLRIAPLYFGFLILFFACFFIFTAKKNLHFYPIYTQHWWDFFFFFENWTFILSYPFSSDHLLHFWSLATEEQFYLLFPWLIIFIKDRRKLINTATLLIIAIIIFRCLLFFIFQKEYVQIYWNSFARMDTLLIGCVLFLFLGNKPTAAHNKYQRYFIWVALLIWGAIFFIDLIPDKRTIFLCTIGFTLIAIVYAYFIHITILKTNKLINTITSLTALQYIGKISYGIYIFHWPIYLLMPKVLKIIFESTQTEISLHYFNISVVICSLICTYILSYLSYTYFESKFLKLKIKYG